MTEHDPALHLALTDRQITAPTAPGTAPLPPARHAAGWLAAHGPRLLPTLVTAAAWGLARLWHAQLPAGSTEPLWIMGALTALAAAGGTVAAAKRHGDRVIVGTAYAAGAVCAMTGIAAQTPQWALSVLLWLLATVAAYGLCVPAWRRDRREEAEHVRAMEREHQRGQVEIERTRIQTQGQVATEMWRARREEAAVDRIVAAADARTHRMLAPGQELDVAALLAAAGHADAPVELPGTAAGQAAVPIEAPIREVGP